MEIFYMRDFHANQPPKITFEPNILPFPPQGQEESEHYCTPEEAEKYLKVIRGVFEEIDRRGK
jgi:hypothetical protein